MDKDEEALADYNFAVELDLESVEGYKNRAKLYRKMGKNTEADEAMIANLEKE